MLSYVLPILKEIRLLGKSLIKYIYSYISVTIREDNNILQDRVNNDKLVTNYTIYLINEIYMLDDLYNIIAFALIK